MSLGLHPKKTDFGFCSQISCRRLFFFFLFLPHTDGDSVLDCGDDMI